MLCMMVVLVQGPPLPCTLPMLITYTLAQMFTTLSLVLTSLCAILRVSSTYFSLFV